MGRETMHVIQSFRRAGRRLVADAPRKMKTAEAAIAGARQLSTGRAGVAAYTIDMDPEVDFTGEPQVIFRAGELPGELAE